MATFGWICLLGIIIFGLYKLYKVLKGDGVIKIDGNGGSISDIPEQKGKEGDLVN